MSAQNIPEPDAADGSEEPNIDAEEVRDFFIDEDEPLDVSDISEEFEVSEETA